MKFKLIHRQFKQIQFFAIVAEPDEEDFVDCKFSVLSLENHAGCKGVRLFTLPADCRDLDDHWDRALFGISLNYSSLVIEILWVKILIA